MKKLSFILTLLCLLSLVSCTEAPSSAPLTQNTELRPHQAADQALAQRLSDLQPREHYTEASNTFTWTSELDALLKEATLRSGSPAEPVYLPLRKPQFAAAVDYLKRLIDFLDETKASVVCEPEEPYLNYDPSGAFLAEKGTLLFCYSDCGRNTEYKVSLPIRRIGALAFAGNKHLRTLLLHPNLTEIGESALADCSSLESVITDLPLPEDRKRPNAVIPVSIAPTSVFGYVLYDNDPPSNPSVGKYLHENAALKWSARSVPVDDHRNHYQINGEGVLTAYYGVGGHLVIPEGVTEIRADVFRRCGTSVISVTLPSTLKKLCSGAFNGCSFLTGLEIPEGIEVIEGNLFLPSSSLPFWVSDIPETCKVSPFAFHQKWMNEFKKS